MDLLNKIDMFVGYTVEDINEETEYQKFFKKKLKAYNISSPSELDDEKKKKFFDEIKKEWTSGKGEKKTNEGELPPALKKAIEAKKKKDGDDGDGEEGESKKHEDSESDKEEKEEHKKGSKKDKADK